MRADQTHRNQWNNHIHHNTQFLRGTPRTAREAFGASLDTGSADVGDRIIFWLVVVGAVVSLCFWGR